MSKSSSQLARSEVFLKVFWGLWVPKACALWGVWGAWAGAYPTGASMLVKGQRDCVLLWKIPWFPSLRGPRAQAQGSCLGYASVQTTWTLFSVDGSTLTEPISYVLFCPLQIHIYFILVLDFRGCFLSPSMHFSPAHIHLYMCVYIEHKAFWAGRHLILIPLYVIFGAPYLYNRPLTLIFL